MLRTLLGEAMFAMTRCISSNAAKISFGETFGCPFRSTVANQQRTLLLAHSLISVVIIGAEIVCDASTLGIKLDQ